MANIQTLLQRIMSAIYGEEVRGSIHDAIQAMNEEVEDIKAIDVTVDHNEIVGARTDDEGTTHASLGDSVRSVGRRVTDVKNANDQFGHLFKCIKVNPNSVHSSDDDKLICNLKQGHRYFYSLINGTGVASTEVRCFYSDRTNSVVKRTTQESFYAEQLFPSKDVIAIGVYISNESETVSETQLKVWDTIQIQNEYYNNIHVYIDDNRYITRTAASDGGSEITIPSNMMLMAGTDRIKKDKSAMLSEIDGATESGDGVKFTMGSSDSLVYNYMTGSLYLRNREAVRPSEIDLLTTNYNGLCSGELLNKVYQKLINDNAVEIDHITDILSGNVGKESIATIPAGAEAGVWLKLNGKTDPIKVICESDIITKYRIYKTDGKYSEYNVGTEYYVNDIRGTAYQVQIPLAYMKTEDGIVVGGNAVFTWSYQEDELIKQNSLNGDCLKDNSISYDKLSNSTIEQLYENSNDIIIEGFADAEVENVEEKLDAVQTKNTSSIAFVTDLHVLAFSKADEYWESMFNRLASTIKKIDTKNMIDFTVLGGDYLWNDKNSTKSLAEDGYKILQKAFYPLKDKLFALKGNHDDNSIAYQGGQPIEALVLPDEEYRFLGKQYEKNGAVFNPSDHNIYGYYDIPSQKIRCIFVNTADLPYNITEGQLDYGAQHVPSIRQEQSEFIQKSLVFTESGWSVIFFSHHGLVSCDVTGSNQENYCPDIWEIIKAYKNKTSYTGTVTNRVIPYNVNVDYTNNESNDVIACVCGHVHDDLSDVVDGILVVSTTAACPDMVEHQRNTADETSYDIYTINKQERKLYASRYGLGNDREWDY